MVPNTSRDGVLVLAGQSCGCKAGIKKETKTGFFHIKKRL